MAKEDNTPAITITRDQEQRLYSYLRLKCDGDSLRYELIAKKIQRTADRTASVWDAEITNSWLRSMLKQEESSHLAMAANDSFIGTCSSIKNVRAHDLDLA